MKKLFKSYYAKMSLTIFVLIFSLITSISITVVMTLHTRSLEQEMQGYDAVAKAILEEFRDIWDEYYKVFIPLTESDNKMLIREFCIEGVEERDDFDAKRNLMQVLEKICLQDDRIQGIYFYRRSDETGYLYSAFHKGLREWNLDSRNSARKQERSIIGGQKINSVLGGIKKEMLVFGIQSAVLNSGNQEKNTEYQITVFYNNKNFDSVLHKYGVDTSKERYMITTQQGLVLYDSNGLHQEEEIYFDQIVDVMCSGDAVSIEGITYQKGMYVTGRGNCCVFYLNSKQITPSNTFFYNAGWVMLLALAILLILFLAILSINRLIGRKFGELEGGLEQIGMHNLNYRIPVKKKENEFTRIATRFNRMCDDLENAINKNYVYQMLQQNSEYKALQTSVNPHFLYNSLEILRERLDRDGKREDAEMVLLLSRMFEYQIRGSSIVTLRREQQALRNYINFVSIHYQYSFEYSIDFEENILECPVPKQILQPILENYMNHGFRNDDTDFIEIRGCRNPQDHKIHISFRDNGKGMTTEQITALKKDMEEKQDYSHMGLANIHNRLKIAYGNEGYMEISSNAPEQGICVTLVLGSELKLGIYSMLHRDILA